MSLLALKSIDDLLDKEIHEIFYTARCGDDKFSDKILMTAFFEASTRTRLSFEIAAHRLGMGVVTFDHRTSSQSKGETYLDTIDSLLAQKPDVLAIRSPFTLELKDFLAHDSIIINAGDGINEHPTQALLDSFTLLNYWRIDSLVNKSIMIIGDARHSRVAHSNIKLLRRLGAYVIVLSPPCYELTSDWGQSLAITHFKEAPKLVDAVMCLRVQKERIGELTMHDDDYHKNYGLTEERFLALGDQCVVLHPGPMNVGIEIDKNVARHKRSLILKQIEHGVMVRKALITCMLRGKGCHSHN